MKWGPFMDNLMLLQGTCLELMKSIPEHSVNFLLTDLPYGTTKCRWDSEIDLNAFWKATLPLMKQNGCIAMFAQTPFDKILGVSNLDMLRYEWIWEKTRATGFLNARKMPMKAHENILIFYNKLPKYHPQMSHGHPRKISTAQHKQHCLKGDCYGQYGLSSYDSTDRYPRSILKGPTEKEKGQTLTARKPVWLCRYLIETYTDPGDLVLDCCMGTGAIGEAAVGTGRKFIGMELDRERFQEAKNRITLVQQENNR